MALTLQLEMAKRNSVGSVQRNMQSSKNFQPAYGTAQDDDVSPRCCCCPSVLLTVHRTAASAVRWSPSSPTCWSSSRCPSPSGAASRWCRSTREPSSSDSAASSQAGPRVRACSSSCHASTPTGRYLVSSQWHGLQLNFRYLCINRYCWNIDGYKCNALVCRCVDLRTGAFDVPPQEILTRDSVTINVDAVVYYQVNTVQHPDYR